MLCLRQGDYSDEDDSDVVFERSSSSKRHAEDEGGDSDDETSDEDEVRKSGSSTATMENGDSPLNKDDNNRQLELQNRIEIRLMYIQMEYCDKQTLRNAIDENLHKDSKRLWRMFRVCDFACFFRYFQCKSVLLL